MMVSRNRPNILVVEDDPAILNGLLDVLIFHGYNATGLEDGGLGLKKALNEFFDLVILDIMLPTLDGLSICRSLREKKPMQPIIMLTAKGSESDVIAGFRAGADDYVTKPFSISELMVRVEAILRRTGKGAIMEKFEVCGIRFDPENLFAHAKGKKESLTRRELEIVAYLFRNPERIISKSELLKEVWKYADPDIETRTVDIHMGKLRKKFVSLVGRTPVIETIRGEGYRLLDKS